MGRDPSSILGTVDTRYCTEYACPISPCRTRGPPRGTTTTCWPQWSGTARSIPQLTGANTTGLGLDTRLGCSRPTLPVGRADHPANLAALA